MLLHRLSARVARASVSECPSELATGSAFTATSVIGESSVQTLLEGFLRPTLGHYNGLLDHEPNHAVVLCSFLKGGLLLEGRQALGFITEKRMCQPRYWGYLLALRSVRGMTSEHPSGDGITKQGSLATG